MAVNDDNRASAPSFSPPPPLNEDPSAAGPSDAPDLRACAARSRLAARGSAQRRHHRRDGTRPPNAEADADIASVLYKHVGDALTAQIDSLNTALENDIPNQGAPRR